MVLVNLEISQTDNSIKNWGDVTTGIFLQERRKPFPGVSYATSLLRNVLQKHPGGHVSLAGLHRVVVLKTLFFRDEKSERIGTYSQRVLSASTRVS